jgi:hypothetical protein
VVVVVGSVVVGARVVVVEAELVDGPVVVVDPVVLEEVEVVDAVVVVVAEVVVGPAVDDVVVVASVVAGTPVTSQNPRPPDAAFWDQVDGSESWHW